MRKPILGLAALLLTVAGCDGHDDPAPAPTASSPPPAQFGSIDGGLPWPPRVPSVLDMSIDL